MPQPARVKLTSTNIKKLDGVCAEILGIGKKTGVKIKGPIPLPTRKSPCGSGTPLVFQKRRFLKILRRPSICHSKIPHNKGNHVSVSSI